jgi:transcriptional regulator
MYIPPSMRERDPRRIRQLIRQFPFATLITWRAGCEITHLPMQPGDGDSLILWGHVARANPHADTLAGHPDAVAVFQGPHGYISPRWYRSDGMVPTWNYVAIHARGAITTVDGDEAADAMRRQVASFEGARPSSWQPSDELLSRRIAGVLVFRLEVAAVEAKLKLSQNRSLDDRRSARAALEQNPSEADRELARWMRASEPDDA